MMLIEIEFRILEHFVELDEDYCYGYDEFVVATGLSKEELKPAMKSLREKGFVEYHRGLINDDGETAGSGFGLNYRKKSEAWDWVDQMRRHFHYNELFSSEKQERETLENMTRFAGSFVKKLRELYELGDYQNKYKLREAFKDYFITYRDWGKGQ